MSEEREARISDLRAAIEGECDGLHTTYQQAAAIIDYMDSEQAARQSAGAPCAHGVDDGACKQCYAEKAQRHKLQERFAQRPQTPASADFDLPAPNDVIGDNGATEKIPPVIYNGDTKRDPALKERLQLQAQPTESRRVELTEDERADIRTAAAIARHSAHGFLADRLEALARDQAKGE